MSSLSRCLIVPLVKRGQTPFIPETVQFTRREMKFGIYWCDQMNKHQYHPDFKGNERGEKGRVQTSLFWLWWWWWCIILISKACNLLLPKADLLKVRPPGNPTLWSAEVATLKYLFAHIVEASNVAQKLPSSDTSLPTILSCQWWDITSAEALPDAIEVHTVFVDQCSDRVDNGRTMLSLFVHWLVISRAVLLCGEIRRP